MSAIARQAFEAAGDALPRPHPNTYWLAVGHILAGEHPAAGNPAQCEARIEALVAAGVRRFFDLTEPVEPLVAYAPFVERIGAERGIALAHRRFAIPDFGVPTETGMRAILAALDEPLASSGIAYLHCRGGIGRTGTVAGCLLVENGWTGDGALALVDRKWRVMAKASPSLRSPENDVQREMIERWSGRAMPR